MSSGARHLWMFQAAVAGATDAVLLQEARRLKLVAVVDLGGSRAEVSNKLGDLSCEDALRLRAAVYKRLGIDDADAYEREQVTGSEAYRRWLLDREANPPLYRQRGNAGSAA